MLIRGAMSDSPGSRLARLAGFDLRLCLAVTFAPELTADPGATPV